ncbi:dTDP-4-dehydrorhamnose reductase [Propionibacterium sp.]|uniref:dTDP-4-dehydrorhamnose reductase n=1 Tax=Propionibacterium sp. TaxID=1977903 RepID=UPI0039EC5389
MGCEDSNTLEYSKTLGVSTTPIPGFLRVDLTVHGDNRGWFKENWQRAKMVELGVPDFGPVQNNISFNDEAGVTRGIHAEPWDKFISVATGRVFGAWVDLREGPSFGAVYTCEIDPSVAVYVPRGVGNAYQTLEPNTAYSYLVNAHWSPKAEYTFLNLADETVAIDWPIPLDHAILSDKDKLHPRMAEVTPFPTGKQRVLVTGSNGQLGRELMKQLPAAGFEVTGAGHVDLDITDAAAVQAFDWSGINIIVNAGAWTDVDGAETDEGRKKAWACNAVGPANLARVANQYGLTLVHISTDYVFDGTQSPHSEDEALSPLGVYGQSKAAGDMAVTSATRHYLVRTSWVIGDGNNFVRTMAGLAARGISPKVVNDQIGRLTFTEDLAAGIIHLLSTKPDYGTYNLTNEGEAMSWADVAKLVFTGTGHDATQVTGISSAEYFAGKVAAPRPLNSCLDLTKLEATGWLPKPTIQRLHQYLKA